MGLQGLFLIHLFKLFVDLAVIFLVSNGHLWEHDFWRECDLEVVQSVDEIRAFGQVDTDLQDKQEPGFVNFGMKLFRRAEELDTVVLVHGNGEQVVDEHEDDNKELEDVKVKSPELPAAWVLLPQDALEQEQNAYNCQHQIRDGEVQ